MNYRDAKKYIRALSTVRYVVERPFTIAIVEIIFDNCRPMIAKGLSTCSFTDKWDQQRGQNVAKGRAEAKLARRIMRKTARAIGCVQTGIVNGEIRMRESISCISVTINGEEAYCL